MDVAGGGPLSHFSMHIHDPSATAVLLIKFRAKLIAASINFDVDVNPAACFTIKYLVLSNEL